MEKQFLIAAVISAVLFSCKKSDDSIVPPGGANTVSKIKTWTSNSGTATYIYDAEGRLIEAVRSTGGKTTYEYLSGQVIQKQFNSSGVNDFSYHYELGPEGLVFKETRPATPSFSASNIYNSSRQLLKSANNFAGQSNARDYFYSNGNCDSIRLSTNGNWINTLIKTYYTDKPNSIGYDAEGLSFFGKGNKNLVKTEQYFLPDGTKNDITTFTYEFDSKGRAIKQTGTQGANIFIEYITYND